MTRRLLPQALALIIIAPVVLYTAFLVRAASVSCWKTGWAARPFIFVGTANIFAYVIYTAAISLGLWIFYRKTHLFVVGVSAWIAGLMLILYWLGFLTVSFGVLPTH